MARGSAVLLLALLLATPPPFAQPNSAGGFAWAKEGGDKGGGGGKGDRGGGDKGGGAGNGASAGSGGSAAGSAASGGTGSVTGSASTGGRDSGGSDHDDAAARFAFLRAIDPGARLASRGSVRLAGVSRNAAGERCRSYMHRVTIDGAPVQAFGTVCRRGDGRWVLVDRGKR